MDEADHNTTGTTSAPRKLFHFLYWVLWILIGLVAVTFFASFFLDEPLRKLTEKKLNSHLNGYTVRLPGLHVQLIGFSLTFKDLSISQKAHPSEPIILLPKLKASVHWQEILSGRLVGELNLVRPVVNVNLAQLQAEVKGPVPVNKRGWQQAVEDIYPLKINRVTIEHGEISYTDPDGKLPLKLTDVNFEADNIRNIHLPDKVYPSSFHLDTSIFGKGKGIIAGKANLLAEPFPGIKARYSLKEVPVSSIKPIIARANLAITGGVLDSFGEVEYAPTIKTARIQDMVINGMSVDYIHSTRTAAAEKHRAGVVKATAKKLGNKPGLLLRVDHLKLTGCTFGMINREKVPNYRIFLSESDLNITNFSNQFSQGTSHARLNGKFMGTGTTVANAAFRPETSGPDLDLFLKVDNAQLSEMNSILRAYANFSVTAGTFSLVTELHVRNGGVTGYLKPFFKEMKIRKEPSQGPMHRLYEALVGGVAKLLENRPRKQVATKADISGPLGKPHTNTIQIVLQLVKNAFFKAILPTFEREAKSAPQN